MKENGQNKWHLSGMKTISIPARGKGNFDPKIGGLKAQEVILFASNGRAIPQEPALSGGY